MKKMIFILLLSTVVISVSVTDSLLSSSIAGQYVVKEIWSTVIQCGDFVEHYKSDLNGDNVPDLVMRSCLGYLAIDGNNGNILWSYSDPLIPLFQEADYGDFNGDGFDDIAFFGSFNNYIDYSLAIDGPTGSLMWIYEFAPHFGMGHSCQEPSPDLDGDGGGDVIVGSKNDSPLMQPELLAISGKTGTLIWQYRAQNGVTGISPSKWLFDVNGDGTKDIIAYEHNSSGVPSYITLLDGKNGFPIWSHFFEENYGVGVDSLVDLNSDGIPEVIAYPGIGEEAPAIKYVYALDSKTGAEIWQSDPLNHQAWSPKTGDFNGDGIGDFVVDSYYSIYALDGENGDLMWSFTPEGPLHDPDPRVMKVLDINNDGLLEVVLSATLGLDNEKSGIYVLDARNGSVIWRLISDITNNTQVNDVADLDGDGIFEVIAFSQNTNTISALDGSTGSSIWTYNLELPDSRLSQVFTSDLTGDGNPEVIGHLIIDTEVEVKTKTFALTMQPQTIELLAPNGGEIISSGSTYTIQWIAPVQAVKFDLKYSLNNGTTWKSIANKVSGTNYNWTLPIPANNKTKCLMKVIGYDALGVRLGEDISDNPFTIEVMRVTSPNGGETLRPGEVFFIRWDTNATKKPVANTYL
ncbi:MAG TPA: FG-GAP-like repeat-containing protein, partial [Thermodesulfovibrionales bacterium]|nr:FG-GAP-like repeat-containing protein [Thermodesulfovibrionales bacterium]